MSRTKANRAAPRRNSCGERATAKSNPAPAEAVDVVGKQFAAATAAFERFNLQHPDCPDNGALNAEFDRLYEQINRLLKPIQTMKATDLKSLRLKALAVYWCNDDFSHLRGNTTDVRITKTILIDLLNLPLV
jgi:hypothetical protein